MSTIYCDESGFSRPNLYHDSAPHIVYAGIAGPRPHSRHQWSSCVCGESSRLRPAASRKWIILCRSAKIDFDQPTGYSNAMVLKHLAQRARRGVDPLRGMHAFYKSALQYAADQLRS